VSKDKEDHCERCDENPGFEGCEWFGLICESCYVADKYDYYSNIGRTCDLEKLKADFKADLYEDQASGNLYED